MGSFDIGGACVAILVILMIFFSILDSCGL